jgi:hypothetical protein
MLFLDFPSSHIPDAALVDLPAVAMERLAGETDEERLSQIANDWLLQIDLLYALAIMCSPDDPTYASGLVEAVTAEEIFQASDLLSLEFTEVKEQSDYVAIQPELVRDGSPVPAQELVSAIGGRENPFVLIRDLLKKNRLAHVAAGYILRRIISRSRANLPDASLTEAARAVEFWCKKHNIVGGGKENVIRNLWSKYQTVSHLWGALQIAQSGQLDLTTRDGFGRWLGTAYMLRELGCSIVPKGRRPGDTVLLRPSTWEIPPQYLFRDNAGRVAVLWSDDPKDHDISTAGPPPARSLSVGKPV